MIENLNKEILQKAVEKAQKNTNTVLLIPLLYYQLIFSHDFAKAFWSEELVCLICGSKCRPWAHCCTDNNDTLSEWKYHLQQMVLEEDPLKYLEKFLNEE